jgi:Zn-dependent protease with chaperone function
VRELVVQALLHACVAAAMVELLVAGWRPASADERLALRGLALGLPLLMPGLLAVAAPFRLEPWFVDGWALFAARHWADVRLFGAPVGTLLLTGAAVSGAWLYWRDLAPLVRDRRRRDEAGRLLPPDAPLAALVEALARSLGLRAVPRVWFVDEAVPVLFASGTARPTLVVSQGTLARLDAAALRAVLAHELVHLARRDLWLGWTVMVVRTIMMFSPVTQLVARGVALEVERRADDTAARAIGDPAVLASAIERLLADRAPSGEPRPGARRGLGGDVAARVHAFALERRTARLRAPRRVEPRRLSRWRVTLAGVALAALLFFVV